MGAELHANILDVRYEIQNESSQRYLLRQLVKEVFYLRPESFFEVKKLVFRNAKKLDLSEVVVESLIGSLNCFYESEFYRETVPALVNHISIEEFPSFEIGEIDVMGSVHLAWITAQGQFHILKISSSIHHSDNSFAALYAMKKFQVVPEKLNVGFLSTDDWSCTWNPIDWHSVSELQDKALSFTDSDNFLDFPRTEQISRCDICEYSQVCYTHSSELDSK
ncbi:MAG: hypothetical protein NE328_00905 [Lentisphaeraceae bacterium]|nr:hypothetical protein [Lentisphaeraceae bacterium]